VRSVEKNLLSREKAEAMIDSKTPADAIKILYDLGYGEGADPVPAEKFGELLAEETKKTYSFIRGIAPEEKDLYAFLYPYDYHNLKVLIKAELQDADPEPFLIDVGTIEAGRLAAMYRDRDFVGMTSMMKEAVLEVLDVFARTKDPQTIDFILDKACYREMTESAAATGNAYIIGYVKLLIDTINLKTFVRLRQMKKSWDVFSQVFLPGGRIQEKLFVNSYDEPYEQFVHIKRIAVEPVDGGKMSGISKGSVQAPEHLDDSQSRLGHRLGDVSAGRGNRADGRQGALAADLAEADDPSGSFVELCEPGGEVGWIAFFTGHFFQPSGHFPKSLGPP
jgi:hypothetical protein